MPLTEADIPHIGVPYDPPPAKNPNLTPDDPQWVVIVAGSLHWDLYCLLGDGEVQPSGGRATFDEVTVPQAKTILDWTGRELWQLTLPLTFDSWGEDLEAPDPVRRREPPAFRRIKNKKKRHQARDRWREFRDRNAPSAVQDYVELVTDLSQPRGRHKAPAAIRVYGKAIRPKRINGMAFHIVDIEWGRYLHNKEGQLRRQLLTLTLNETNQGDEYKLKRRKRKDSNEGSDQKTYVVKEGDTLQKIAAQVYGDPNKWERIARANDIKNPRKLEVGARLRIPR